MQVLDGKGKLTTTGQLGDVMQESAQAALSYIRSRSQHLGLPKDFYRNVDIHVHVPGGRHSQGWSVGGHYAGHRGWRARWLRYACGATLP